MLRQMSSRNQRVRVFRPSHALQIIVLFVISVWLFYQTMHSHDKKASLEEGTSKMEESQFQILELGRKDLHNTAQTMVSVAQIHSEGEDEDAGEVKQEKSDGGEEKETQEDVIDEADQDRTDKETEHGGREVTDEKEKDSLAEESESSDDQEHESSQEAREKTFKGDDASSAVADGTFKGDDASSAVAEGTFKGDDASSAVAEGTKTAESESENGNPKNWDEEQAEMLESKDTEAEITDDVSKDNSSSIGGLVNGSKSNDADVFLEDKKIVSNNSLPGNATSTEKRESEVVFSKPEGSNFNSTFVGSNDQTELLTNATTVNVSSSQKEVQMNSTSAFASGSQVETQGSGIVVGTRTNNVTPRNETSTVGSLEVLNATMEIGSHGKNTSDPEKLEQVGSSTDRLEQPKESSSTTLNEKGDTTQGGSGDSSHDALTKQEIGAHFVSPTLTNIQSKAKSSVSEVAE